MSCHKTETKSQNIARIADERQLMSMKLIREFGDAYHAVLSNIPQPSMHLENGDYYPISTFWPIFGWGV